MTHCQETQKRQEPLHTSHIGISRNWIQITMKNKHRMRRCRPWAESSGQEVCAQAWKPSSQHAGAKLQKGKILRDSAVTLNLGSYGDVSVSPESSGEYLR